MTKLDIEKVAIIGAGPGGLASIYELSHTNRDGTSTVGTGKSEDPKFTKIVAFEQKDKAGGIWAPSINTADLKAPPQDILDTGKYNDPDVIHPEQKAPGGIENSSFEKPVKIETKKIYNELEWKRSGVYRELFTNVPARFTRFSYLPNEKKYLDEKRAIYPFLTQEELSGRIEDFVEREGLNDYIRFNTRVEHVTKNAEGKWIITVKQKNENDGEEYWYKEEFDAVIVSNGHYSVPNIPYIEGLAEFNKTYPGSVIHSKSYRSSEEFKDQKVLVVGFGVSTAGLVQYIVPVAKETIIAQRSPNLVFEWINGALVSKGITRRPEIERIDAVKNEIIFKDGSIERNVDKILLTTGYHFHYPFLQDYLKVVSPSNVSRVNGLYYHTFSIDDPTLATVGVTVAHLNFHTIEASAAAVAGVWSGAKSLPSKQEQKNWEQQHVKDTGNNLVFHFYENDQVKPEFVDKLSPLHPDNRPDIVSEDLKYLNEFDIGTAKSEKLFYQLKDGKLNVKDIFPV